MASEEDEQLIVAKRRIGTVLCGKYRIDAVLGLGGMAVVYKATHRNEAEFAVKMLHPELSVHESIRTRFLREGKAANSVTLPRLLRTEAHPTGAPAEEGAGDEGARHGSGRSCGIPHALGRAVLESLPT
jgi:serine/threonine protein kinase